MIFSPTKLEFTAAQTAELLKSNNPPHLLDIRGPEEWKIVHLEGGQLISTEFINEIVQDWEKDTPIVCYCHHGVRSIQITYLLMQKGFTNVHSMKGGIDAWAKDIDPSMVRY